jgi:hypothetical protein
VKSGSNSPDLSCSHQLSRHVDPLLCCLPFCLVGGPAAPGTSLTHPEISPCTYGIHPACSPLLPAAVTECDPVSCWGLTSKTFLCRCRGVWCQHPAVCRGSSAWNFPFIWLAGPVSYLLPICCRLDTGTRILPDRGSEINLQV